MANFASQGDWLTVTAELFATATTTPEPELLVGIQGNAIPFPAGTYSSQIVLTDINGAQLGTIPVSLQVSSAGCSTGQAELLFASSGPLTFQLPQGAKSGTLLNIYNTFPTDLTIIPNISMAAQSWLSSVGQNLIVVTGLGYPTPFGVGVDTTSLQAGQTYTGDVSVRSSNSASLDIPVTVVAGTTGGMLATPSPLNLEYPPGQRHCERSYSTDQPGLRRGLAYVDDRVWPDLVDG